MANETNRFILAKVKEAVRQVNNEARLLAKAAVLAKENDTDILTELEKLREEGS